MPELVRLYIRNVLIGLMLSAVFVAALLYFNVGSLWHLVSATKEGPIAVVMLLVFNTVVFAGVQFAIAVMRMAEPEDGGDKGLRSPEPVAEPVLIPVVAPVPAGKAARARLRGR